MAIEYGELAQHQAVVSNLNALTIEHVERRDRSGVYQMRIDALERRLGAQQALLFEPTTQLTLLEVAAKRGAGTKSFEAAQYESPTVMDFLAHRLAQFEGYGVISDFDLSMTHGVPHETVYLKPNVPGSVLLEELLAQQGRGAFNHGFVRYIQPHLRGRESRQRIHDAGRIAVDFRPGVFELFEDLREEGIPRTILSANFKPFVEGAISDTPLDRDPDLVIRAVTHDDTTSTDKHTVIQLIAAQDPRRATVYIGDGASDENADADIIFALEDSPYDQSLTRQGKPHLTYVTFHDVNVQLHELAVAAEQLRQQSSLASSRRDVV